MHRKLEILLEKLTVKVVLCLFQRFYPKKGRGVKITNIVISILNKPDIKYFYPSYKGLFGYTLLKYLTFFIYFFKKFDYLQFDGKKHLIIINNVD